MRSFVQRERTRSLRACGGRAPRLLLSLLIGVALIDGADLGRISVPVTYVLIQAATFAAARNELSKGFVFTPAPRAPLAADPDDMYANNLQFLPGNAPKSASGGHGATAALNAGADVTSSPPWEESGRRKEEGIQYDGYRTTTPPPFRFPRGRQNSTAPDGPSIRRHAKNSFDDPSESTSSTTPPRLSTTSPPPQGNPAATKVGVGETANEECPVYFHGQGCLKRCKPEIHCSGNGRCSHEGNCVCYDGFHGDDCAKECFEEHGCAAIEHGCAVGFFGDDCTNHMIDFDVANGRPVGVEGSLECYFNFEGQTCDQCATGYYGRNCENFCKSDTTCNARGFCSQHGLCACLQGFRGENCEQCAQGFYGADCSIFCDTNTTCSGTGMCDLEGSCVCDEGFTGKECEKD